MGVRPSSLEQADIVVAGGGFAALEAALALRALAGDRIRLTLVSPGGTFLYRPAATLEAFDGAPPRVYELRAIAGDVGAAYHDARLEAVAAENRSVRLSSGIRLQYDALVLAIGARARNSVAGGMVFRDQRDLPMFRGVLSELEAGAVAHLAFAVPSGTSYPLPLYELALLSASRAAQAGVDAEVALVTPERQPLSVFGPRASTRVAELLAERGIRFLGNSSATAVRRDRSLMLGSDGVIRADRVITTPQLRAQRITGVPARAWGFVPTDELGRVEGLEAVFAAGDMTTFPVKQGSLAAHQADAVAHGIAQSLGARVKALRPSRVLQARLVGGERPLVLRTELDWRGRPVAMEVEEREDDDAATATKVFARYLTAYLEALDERLAAGRAVA